MIDGETLYSANVGDSKAILIWDPKVKNYVNKNKEGSLNPNITVLTTNHSPDSKLEKLRIQKSKGDIRAAKTALQVLPKDQAVLRIYHKGKEYPGLAVSRSIGDQEAHSLGVIEKPGKLCCPNKVSYRYLSDEDRTKEEFLLFSTGDRWTLEHVHTQCFPKIYE